MGHRRLFTWAIDVTILLLAVIAIWRYTRPTAADLQNLEDARVKLIAPGRYLALSEVAWDAAPRHAVPVVRTSCPACRDSVPFLRRLSDRAVMSPDVALVVVGDESPGTMRTWLEGNGIRADTVVSRPDIVSLGVLVEPMIALVDNRGYITDVMVSRLSPGDEARVLQRAFEPGTAAPLDNTAYASEVQSSELERLTAGEEVVYIDTRERDRFKRNGRSTALNIPRDELNTRAPAEITADRVLAIECGRDTVVGCRSAGRALRMLGFSRVFLVMP